MKFHDFTKEKWNDIIKPIDDTPCIHANDNGHEEWQDWFHVKPFATDSLFYKVDWDIFSNYEEYRKIDNVIYLRW